MEREGGRGRDVIINDNDELVLLMLREMPPLLPLSFELLKMAGSNSSVYKEGDPIGVVDFQAIVPSPTTRARDFNAKRNTPQPMIKEFFKFKGVSVCGKVL